MALPQPVSSQQSPLLLRITEQKENFCHLLEAAFSGNDFDGFDLRVTCLWRHTRQGWETFDIQTSLHACTIISGEFLWHHACFSLRNGEALRAPALDPVPCWRVERLGDKIFVREKVSPPAPKRGTEGPSLVVIVGGGAAGLAAADMLRREGYEGPLAIVSADASPPVDRPNLSKDYLAGTAQEDWIPPAAATRMRDPG